MPMAFPAGPPAAMTAVQRPGPCRLSCAPSLGAQVDSHLMVGDPVIPPAERLPGGFLDHGPLVVVSGKAPHRGDAGEPRDGGEHDLLALVPAQQPGAAEAIDGPQVLAHLGFVMMLVVIGGRPRRPSAPNPRDHISLIPPVLARSWTPT